MKDLNKQFLEDLEGKLNSSAGLSKSAEIIEKSKTQLAAALNDLFDDTDKPLLEKVKKAYTKKLPIFENAIKNAKIENEVLSDSPKAWSLLARIHALSGSLVAWNNPFEKNMKRQLEKIRTTILKRKKADLDAFVNDLMTDVSSDAAKNTSYLATALDLKGLDPVNTKILTPLSNTIIILATTYGSIKGKWIDSKTNKTEYALVKNIADTLDDTAYPAIIGTLYAQKSVNKIEDILSGKNLRVKTTAEKDETKLTYEKLENAGFNFNAQLDATFDKRYETQLEEQLETLYAANRMVNKEWKDLSVHEKKYFFMELILKKTDPEWENGKHIVAVDADTCFTKSALQAEFKQKVIDEYAGDPNNETDVKRYIFDRLGVFPAQDKATAITDIIDSKIAEKYKANENELALQLNHYVMAKFNGKIHISDDMVNKLKLRNNYDALEARFKFNKLLEQIHDKHYIAQLEYALDDFFKEYPEMKDRWEKLSPDEKHFFFDELVIQARKSAWKGKRILEIEKKDNLPKDEFYEAFKQKIAKEYTWDVTDLVALKNFVEEKIGTLKFVKPNPEYALGLMRDTIKSKYKSKEEDIWLEFNHYQLAVDSWAVTVTTPAIPGIDNVKELGAVIADTESITEEQARDQAMKEIEEQYAGSMPYGFTRAKLFFFRSRYVNKKIAEKLGNSTGKLITDAEVTSAVNRWHLKKALNMAGADKIEEDDSMFNDPIFNEKLNLLVNDFVTGVNATMSEQEFETAVRTLIDKNPDLKTYMWEKNVSQIGSNFVEIVKSEKNEREYYGKLIELIDTHGKQVNTPEFDIAVRALFAEFVKENKKLPDFVKELKLDIDAANFSEKLATHRQALHKMKLRNVKMKLSMLINTDKEDKWLTAANSVNIDKLGGRGKFYKWMEKHPWRTAIGTSATLVWTATLWAATIPALWLWLGASALFTLNFIKKKGHYTKEHMKFEQDLLAMTTEDRDAYIKSLETDAKKSSSAMRRLFPKKFDKYASSLAYIQKVSSLQIHIDNLNRYLSSWTRLSGSEKLAMEQYLTDAIAAMQLREDEGRNFTFSDEGKSQIEKKYNELHTTIKAWLTRYDPTQNPDAVLSALSGQVGTSADSIKTDSQYEATQNRMRNMRTKLWLFAWAKAAGIYLISAYVIGQIREGWSHVFGSSSTVPGGLPNHVDSSLPPGIEANISKDLGRTINFNSLTPADTKDVLGWLTSHGYNAKWALTDPTHVIEIFKSTTTWGTGVGLHLDPAFGVDAAGNVDGHILLKEVFAGDTAKFEAFKTKMAGLSASDRSTTLWGTLKDLYGWDYGVANAKTHKFFDLFGNKIMEWQNYELVTLTNNSPLSSGGANAIAAKMSHRYTNAGMLTGSELKTVTDPSHIKDLFDGFASGKINLGNSSTWPSWWNLDTINDALHCKYGGFGDGLKDYVFDMNGHGWSSVTQKIGDLTQIFDNGTGDGSAAGWNFARVNSFGVPSVWNEINDFRNKKA